MTLDIIESKRQKSILLLGTFRSTRDKVLSTTIYCQCEKRSCPGRALQYTSNPPSMNKPHIHDADEMKCKVKDALKIQHKQ